MNKRVPALLLLCLLLPLAGLGAVRAGIMPGILRAVLPPLPSAFSPITLPAETLFPALPPAALFPAVADDSALRDTCPYRFNRRDRELYLQALDLYGNKQYTEAAAQLRKLSARNPKAPDPYFYLGLIAVKRGDNPGAIRRYFNKLVAVCPQYPNALAHYWKGIVDYSDGHYAEAVSSFQHYFNLANVSRDKAWLAVYEEASNYLYWSEFLADAYAHPVPFSPQLVTGASSSGDEILPFVTAGGQEIYYLRQVVHRRRDAFFHSENEERQVRLCRSLWRDTAYTKGEELRAPFNLHDNEGGVSLSADGRQLYYSIVEREAGYNNCDLWHSTFTDGQWQPLQPAGSNVNGQQSWESQPSLSADGQWLYFASNREGGYGGTDLWRCRRLPNGDWSRAENLGASVNTAADEKCPFLHADGHTLYFASNGWQGFGGYDEYFIDLNKTNLVRPTNLGLPVNSEGDELCFGVSADGQTAYFSGRQPQPASEESQGTALPSAAPWPSAGGTDIYRFSLYPAAQPEPMRYVAGQLQDGAGQGLGGTIRVLREGQQPGIYPVPGRETDSLRPGQFALMLSCLHANTVIVTAAGYAPAIYAGLDGTQPSLPAVITLQPVAAGKRYSLPVQVTDSLSPAVRQCLDAYAAWLLQNPLIHIRIESAAGARVAHAYLLQLGLRAERLAYQVNGAARNLQIVITQQ